MNPKLILAPALIIAGGLALLFTFAGKKTNEKTSALPEPAPLPVPPVAAPPVEQPVPAVETTQQQEPQS